MVHYTQNLKEGVLGCSRYDTEKHEFKTSALCRERGVGIPAMIGPGLSTVVGCLGASGRVLTLLHRSRHHLQHIFNRPKSTTQSPMISIATEEFGDTYLLIRGNNPDEATPPTPD